MKKYNWGLALLILVTAVAVGGGPLYNVTDHMSIPFTNGPTYQWSVDGR